MASSKRAVTRWSTGSASLLGVIAAQMCIISFAAAYYLPQRPDTLEENSMYNRMLANQANSDQLQRELPHAVAQPTLAAAENQVESNRRQDFDDEEGNDMDQNAAASYRNQPDGNQGASNDGGYDDNEPDGSSYQETPRDQESQSDLERFFDDHLGASDKDGMDKENLPSSWSPVVVKRTQVVANTDIEPEALSSNNQEQLVPFVRSVTIRRPSELDHYLQQEVTLPLVWRRQLSDYQPGFMTLSGSSSIHNPQVPNPLSEILSASTVLAMTELEPTTSKSMPTRLAVEQKNLINKKTSEMAFRQEQSQMMNNVIDNLSPEHYETKSSDIVLLRADDYNEPVYMTNRTDRPFRIAALGNFDPEADFEHASRELDRGDNVKATASNRRRSTAARNRKINSHRAQNQPSQRRSRGDVIDRSIDEMDNEPMSEDASETDEVTFGQDDPYQTDLEAEMRAQDYDRIGRFSAQATDENKKPYARPSLPTPSTTPAAPVEPVEQQEGVASVDNDSDEIDTAAAGAKSYTPAQPRRRISQPSRDREFDSDDAEGSWVNDGADEMEVPSLAHQNMILEKAAQAEQKQLKEEQLDNVARRPTNQHTAEDESPSIAPNHVVDTGASNDADKDNDRR